MNKITIGVTAFVVLILIAGLFFFVTKYQGSGSSLVSDDQTTHQAQVAKSPEPKTESFVAQRVKDFWEAARFKDHRAKYRLLDNKLKAQLSEDEYIRRQEWLDQHDLSGVVEINKVDVTTVTLLGDTAEVRTAITANTGEFADITKLVYEDGEWHKVFESYDTLAVGKTFEEFVAEQDK